MLENLKVRFSCHGTFKNLYDQYHYSPKAVRGLRMIAQALEEKVLKPSNLHGARWLSYVHRAIKGQLHPFHISFVFLEPPAYF